MSKLITFPESPNERAVREYREAEELRINDPARDRDACDNPTKRIKRRIYQPTVAEIEEHGVPGYREPRGL